MSSNTYKSAVLFENSEITRAELAEAFKRCAIFLGQRVSLEIGMASVDRDFSFDAALRSAEQTSDPLEQVRRVVLQLGKDFTGGNGDRGYYKPSEIMLAFNEKIGCMLTREKVLSPSDIGSAETSRYREALELVAMFLPKDRYATIQARIDSVQEGPHKPNILKIANDMRKAWDVLPRKVP